MHDMCDMFDRAKVEALELDIPLDFDTCLKQLNYFDEEDIEIK